MTEMPYVPHIGTSINTSFISNSSNATESPSSGGQSLILLNRTDQLITLWVVFAFVVIGNAIVLISVSLVRHKKSRMNFFIMNLAIADFSVGLLNILPDIIQRHVEEWYAGDALCKIIRYIQASVVYGSSYQLVALSIDRCDAIVNPMNFSGSDRRSTIMVIAMWVVAFVLAIPSLVLFKETMIQADEVQCWFVHPSHADPKAFMRAYYVILAFLLFFIPLIIITMCYTVIIVTIWQKSKVLMPIKKRSGKAQVKNGIYKGDSKYSNAVSAKRNASSRGLIPKAKIKTIKMTLCIVIAFILCWSPFTLWIILREYNLIPDNDTTKQVHIIVQNLPSLNSATNPIIYGFFSTNVCNELRRILSVCFPCIRPPPPPKGHSHAKRRKPLFGWMAGILPCCEESQPRSYSRAATYRDTQYTDVSLTETPTATMSTKSDQCHVRSKEVLDGVYASV